VRVHLSTYPSDPTTGYNGVRTVKSSTPHDYIIYIFITQHMQVYIFICIIIYTYTPVERGNPFFTALQSFPRSTPCLFRAPSHRSCICTAVATHERSIMVIIKTHPRHLLRLVHHPPRPPRAGNIIQQ